MPKIALIFRVGSTSNERQSARGSGRAAPNTGFTVRWACWSKSTPQPRGGSGRVARVIWTTIPCADSRRARRLADGKRRGFTSRFGGRFPRPRKLKPARKRLQSAESDSSGKSPESHESPFSGGGFFASRPANICSSKVVSDLSPTP
jgi:hypothetical protein